jgi:hypothetical protein
MIYCFELNEEEEEMKKKMKKVPINPKIYSFACFLVNVKISATIFFFEKKNKNKMINSTSFEKQRATRLCKGL